jgi:hypothetical protein
MICSYLFSAQGIQPEISSIIFRLSQPEPYVPNLPNMIIIGSNIIFQLNLKTAEIYFLSVKPPCYNVIMW